MYSSIMPLRRSMKNVIKNYSNTEIKVREATSNDPWGPSSTLMTEIADLTYNVIAFNEIMEMMWRRINDHGKNWRHVYKALVLLDYIVKTGSERVASQCKSRIYDIQTLKDFQFLEEQKDHGLNVREKSKALIALLNDPEKLKSEREKAIKAKQRFAKNSSAISSTGVVVHGTGSTMPPVEESIDPALTEELEAVRPSTQGEEELQLALALAMSKEEHDIELKQQRGDDMKLAMAIEQSNKSKDPEDEWPAVDTNPAPLDPWAPGTSTSSAAASTSAVAATHDPWDACNNITPTNDAWSTSATSTSAAAPTTNNDLTSANDEFDLLSTRNPINMESNNAPAPAEAGLFDMGDLLNSVPTSSEPAAPTTKDANKPVSNFLGDNASLVNLDNLVSAPKPTPPPNFLLWNPFWNYQQHVAASNPFSSASILSNPSQNSNGGPSSASTRNPFASQQNAAKGLSMNAMMSANSAANQFAAQNNGSSNNGGSMLPAPLMPTTSTTANNSSSMNANNNPFL